MYNTIMEYAATEAEAGDWESVATILSSTVLVTPNDTLWKWGDIRTALIESFGGQAAQLVGNTIMEAAKVDPDANAA